MHEAMDSIMHAVKWSGVFAPAVFILIQAFRQFFFIPVGVLCLAGGLVFGAAQGTLYSIIGISLSSLLFYIMLQCLPAWLKKVRTLRVKWVGKQVPFSVSQIAILKLVPFVHFHLLSLCLFEMTGNVKEYTKVSILSNIPLAVLYSSMGTVIASLSVLTAAALLIFLAVLFYMVRKKEWVMKWEEFFEKEAA
ncbi:TVP38/TMEM64 family protein [Fictibacillus aquaticus]|uniref:Alkaline phosphatase n=1 Tax=Fictibacillus aquaticus TaxID=2021314 RepID=A0A235FBK2_9BACL|nr:VTT domain-containing protein [Fictibacillus aquaticus]OYD58145.1 alkaline phosphatase [Fictibacillus aquaticus]